MHCFEYSWEINGFFLLLHIHGTVSLICTDSEANMPFVYKIPNIHRGANVMVNN